MRVSINTIVQTFYSIRFVRNASHRTKVLLFVRIQFVRVHLGNNLVRLETVPCKMNYELELRYSASYWGMLNV